jgi:aminomethyltransferase
LVSETHDFDAPEPDAPEPDAPEPDAPEPDEDDAPARLALDGWHRARGARMVSFAGYEMPIQYDGIVAEHLWTRTSAGLFDVSHMGQLQISGPDAAAALEALLPGDIIGLAPGKMRYSLLLGADGGILDDLIVTNAGDHYAIIVNGAMKWDDIAILREHLPDEITLNHGDDLALLALQGPRAATALARLDIVAGGGGAARPDDLYFMEAGSFAWAGVPLTISRSGYTGEDGFEISLPGDQAQSFADALCAQPEVKPIGLGARDSLRLEAGLPLYGHDLSPDIDPVAAGLRFAIPRRRRDAGGFPGADRIGAALADGAAVTRVGLLIEGRQPAREGAEIYDDNQQVGTVTSGGFSPTLQAPIAMGYVSTAQSAPGTPLQIHVRGKPLPATVTAMPFVPHRYHRPPSPSKKGAA